MLIEEAPEPSDIIHENFGVDKSLRETKTAFSHYSLIVLLLVLCAGLIIAIGIIRSYILRHETMNPQGNCHSIYQSTRPEELKTLAYQEYRKNLYLEESGQQTHYDGYMNCFCRMERT